jgi:plastocyanin
MAVPTRGLVLACGVLLAVPGLAQAKTRTVSMGAPVQVQEAFQQSGLEVNDFFPHGVKINVDDTVSFAPAGFHTVDIPAKGGKPLELLSPTGQKVAGAVDAKGAPFWFNNQDVFGFTPSLLQSTFGKKVKYNGKKRVESGAPLGENLKPLKVKFKKAGTYRYYCDVHVGMTGVVKVVKKSAKVPSAKKHDKLVKAQVARDLRRGRALAQTQPPAGTVYTGGSAPGGVEFYGMLPASTTVPAGTTLSFSMSPASFENHTATFGPGDPDKEPTSYLGQIAASFQGPAPDPRAIYPSETPGTTGVLSPLLHGNGFWNSGILDAAAATPLPPANAVRFGTPGTYQFYCMIHTFMHGTVIVT